MIGEIIEGARTAPQIKKKLREAGLQYTDLSKEFGYMNIRVPVMNGYYRIYRNGKRICVQKWYYDESRQGKIPTHVPNDILRY